jgi:hypothetical protein
MEAKTEAFVQDPTETSLVQLRESYEEAYIQFQTVALFGVGMAETVNYRMFLNTYPLDVTTVQKKLGVRAITLNCRLLTMSRVFPLLTFY